MIVTRTDRIESLICSATEVANYLNSLDSEVITTGAILEALAVTGHTLVESDGALAKEAFWDRTGFVI